MRKRPGKYRSFSGFFVLVLVGLVAGTAWAETIELVTYYPTSSNVGNLGVTSLTVGTAYQGTTPANGGAFIVGPVGIGTTTPQGPLHVVGANDVVSNVNFSRGANTGAPGTPQIRVGIGHETGTSVPLHALDVVGFNGANQSIYSRALDGSLARLGLENTIRHWSLSNYGTQFTPTGAFAITDENAGGGVRFLIMPGNPPATAGFVGIGTDNPQAPLQVGASSLFVQNDQGGNIELGGNATIANPVAGGMPYMDFHFGAGAAQDFNARIINSGNNQLSIQTASGGSVLTVSGANVGIGNGYAPGAAVPNGQPGNLDVNDIFLRSTGGWVSQAAGGWISGSHPQNSSFSQVTLPSPWISPAMPAGRRILNVTATPLHESDRDAHPERWDDLRVEISADGRSFRIFVRPGGENFARNFFDPNQGESVSAIAWQVNY